MARGIEYNAKRSTLSMPKPNFRKYANFSSKTKAPIAFLARNVALTAPCWRVDTQPTSLATMQNSMCGTSSVAQQRVRSASASSFAPCACQPARPRAAHLYPAAAPMNAASTALLAPAVRGPQQRTARRRQGDRQLPHVIFFCASRCVIMLFYTRDEIAAKRTCMRTTLVLQPWYLPRMHAHPQMLCNCRTCALTVMHALRRHGCVRSCAAGGPVRADGGER